MILFIASRTVIQSYHIFIVESSFYNGKTVSNWISAKREDAVFLNIDVVPSSNSQSKSGGRLRNQEAGKSSHSSDWMAQARISQNIIKETTSVDDLLRSSNCPGLMKFFIDKKKDEENKSEPLQIISILDIPSSISSLKIWTIDLSNLQYTDDDSIEESVQNSSSLISEADIIWIIDVHLNDNALLILSRYIKSEVQIIDIINRRSILENTKSTEISSDTPESMNENFRWYYENIRISDDLFNLIGQTFRISGYTISIETMSTILIYMNGKTGLEIKNCYVSDIQTFYNGHFQLKPKLLKNRSKLDIIIASINKVFLDKPESSQAQNIQSESIKVKSKDKLVQAQTEAEVNKQNETQDYKQIETQAEMLIESKSNFFLIKHI